MWILIETESDIEIFKYMESMAQVMARDLRHPYIPSTTVLGDLACYLKCVRLVARAIFSRHAA